MRQDAHSFTTVFPLSCPSPAIPGWRECHGRQREESKLGSASDWLWTLSESLSEPQFPSFGYRRGLALMLCPLPCPIPFRFPSKTRSMEPGLLESFRAYSLFSLTPSLVSLVAWI